MKILFLSAYQVLGSAVSYQIWLKNSLDKRNPNILKALVFLCFIVSDRILMRQFECFVGESNFL